MSNKYHRVTPEAMADIIIDIFRHRADQNYILGTDGPIVRGRYLLQVALDFNAVHHVRVAFVVPHITEAPIGVIIERSPHMPDAAFDRVVQALEEVRKANVPVLVVHDTRLVSELANLPLSMALPLLKTLPATVARWVSEVMDEDEHSLRELMGMLHASSSMSWLAQVERYRAESAFWHGVAERATRNKPHKSWLREAAAQLRHHKRQTYNALDRLKRVLGVTTPPVRYGELENMQARLRHYPLARSLCTSIARLLERDRAGVFARQLRRCSFVPLLLGGSKHENASDARWDVARMMAYMDYSAQLTTAAPPLSSFVPSPAVAMLTSDPSYLALLKFQAGDWIADRQRKITFPQGEDLRIARRLRKDTIQAFIPVLFPPGGMHVEADRVVVSVACQTNIYKDYLTGVMGEIECAD